VAGLTQLSMQVRCALMSVGIPMPVQSDRGVASRKCEAAFASLL